MGQAAVIKIEVVAVENKFYGEAITVSGLLVGQDIYTGLKERKNGNLILLPPRVLNHNGLFLDDWTIADLEEKLSVPCHVYTEEISELLNIISKY